ncbi:MAG: hypothetical protein ACTHKG_11810 [Nocardioides sp.]
MTHLRDELARIADDVATGPVPDDLWRRGVRRQRRTRLTNALATAAVILLVVGAGVIGTELLDRAPAPPAGQESGDAIPSRLVTPSRWLDGTADHPPGPIAVLAGAERSDGWWGAMTGVVAVAAGTGTYRFLDLPDAFYDLTADVLGDVSPVLAPDGREVAYWTRHPERAGWVGGVAVCDTVTGEVLRHELPSDLGVVPELLAWGGDGELVVGYGVVTDRRSDGWSSSSRSPFVWRPATDRVVELTSYFGSPDEVSPTADGFAVLRAHRLELRSGPSAALDRVVRLTGYRDAFERTLDPTASSLVMLPQAADGGAVRKLLVGAVGQQRARLEPLGVDVEVLDLLGWQDPQHVVVRGLVPGTDSRRAGAYAVDVRTGEPRLLVREERVSYGMFPDYAGDLWARPTADRPDPVGHEPRVVAAGVAAAVLALGLPLLALRRRRARP